MDILAEIADARHAGVTHAHCTARAGLELGELLSTFDLSPNVSALDPVDPQLAERIAVLVLAHDLAYGTPLMPPAEAAHLAASFMELFTGSEVECFTNASFSDDGGRLSLKEWTPLTDATFDTGIVVLSSDRAGCLWVQDED